MLVDHAKTELDAIGLTYESSEMNGEMRSCILELVEKFSQQGHSGFSANYTIQAITKLLNYEPLSPLTGEDNEWTEVAGGLLQNKRCSRVFKEGDRAYDIDGKVFTKTIEFEGVDYESSFTSSDSRVDVAFPYTPTTEYIHLGRIT